MGRVAERQFVRLSALVLARKGVRLAPTVAALSDDTLVNFLPRVDGARKFAEELKRSVWLEWNVLQVPVLNLKTLIASKKRVRRPKDLAHLPLLEETLRLIDA
jgi:hypothetical protein